MIDLKIEERIATVIFNRPEAMNALNSEMLEVLEEVVDRIEREDVRAIIFTGAGKAFIAGADTKEMENLRGMEVAKFSKKGQDLFRRIETMSIPTIAAINGYAFGGGVEFALACDLRIASEKAKMAFPETSLGITPGFSGTQRLPRTIGRMNSMYMLLTGDTIDAHRAKEFGLVLEVAAPEDLMDRAMALAKSIVKNSKTAVAMAKEMVDRGLDMTLDGGIALENAMNATIFGTPDQIEGMAAFREKRPARFE